MLSISDQEFEQLADYMKDHYGINLSKEKKILVVSRLQNTLLQNGFADFTEYFNYVLNDKTGEALAVLINQLTTNHTFFMREIEHFHYFRDRVLPYLEQVCQLEKDLRVWSAGCSTGEEPYTLAMLIRDYFGMEKKFWDTKILATDISTKSLETAVQGIYQNQQLTSLPVHWRSQYFQPVDGERSAIIDDLKSEVIFRRFNLMNVVFPFKKKFHAIFCRNVMIYFDSFTKKELVNRFYDFTEKKGYLFIGHSETLDRNETAYKYIMPAVYRKE